jgi:hypothetical protein
MRTAFLLALAACHHGYVAQQCPPQADDVSSEGSGRACAAAPTYFKGTGAAGSPCSSSDDCQAVCCGCKNGNGEAYAAACFSGKCATADQLCCGFDQHSAICQRGPDSPYFTQCNADTDCAPGMACIKRYQVTSMDSQIGTVCEDPFQQKVCTKRCTTDADCTAFAGACTGQDACGGAKNLCYQK